MSIRAEALFLNGVYQSVVEEILLVQSYLPTQIMFLQPYKAQRIKHLAESPPSVESRVQLLMSLSNDLDNVRYVGEVVGWDDKQQLQKDLGSDRARVIQRLIWTLQPREGGLYNAAGGDGSSINLLHVWRISRLSRPIAVTRLVNTKDGQPLAGGRSTAGGWVYVERMDDIA